MAQQRKALMTKPTIALIYTGGTIGMVRDQNGTLRPAEMPNDFLAIAPEIQSMAKIDFIPLLNKDSTNIHPSDWTTIAQADHQRLDDGYSGIVIAHGTDTLHYTASALAFALGPELNLPVVLTGAQTAADIIHGDARTNLSRSIKAAHSELAEVVICFGDVLLRGCRAVKTDPQRFNAFASPAHPPLAEITEQLVIHPTARRRKEAVSMIHCRPGFASGILTIALTPGLEPELILPLLNSDCCRAIIIQSFGAGNVPDEQPYSLIGFIEQAVALRKPVIITSPFPASSTTDSHYAPGIAALEAGAIATGNMTAAAAVVKLRWLLAQFGDHPVDIAQLRAQMSEVYVGEMD